MKKTIKLLESDIINIVKKILIEQNKGAYKPEWDKEDQILAMFNSFYGLRELGVTEEYVATKVIGTSLVSLKKQTSNFDYLDGRGGLDRPHRLQKIVYKEFVNMAKNEKNKFKKLCLNIIEEKENNPNEFVTNYGIGKEIGDKRDEIKKSREDELLKLGRDPKKMKLIGSRPVNNSTDDTVDEPFIDNETNIDEPTPPRKKTSKDEVKDYLLKMYNKLVDTNPELADDIIFVNDFIDDELDDKNTLNEIKNILNKKIKLTEKLSLSKKLIKENKMKKRIKLTESQLRNVIKRVIKERTKK